MPTQLITSASPDDLGDAAATLLRLAKDRKVMAFFGELGAGKTTFIKAVCRVLGVEDGMSSPTFALINEYQGSLSGPVYHFDFYRIKNQIEVYDLGYEEYFYSDSYCFIEWPEIILNLLPDNYVKVEIRAEGINRIIQIYY